MDAAKITRRRFLAATLTVGSAITTGCIEVSGKCRREVRDESSVSAGNSVEFNFTLNENDRLYIESIRQGVFGSNPTLEIRDPSGRRVLFNSGDSHTERLYIAESTGEHMVRLENKASLVSGTWDTRIVSYRGYCKKVQ